MIAGSEIDAVLYAFDQAGIGDLTLEIHAVDDAQPGNRAVCAFREYLAGVLDGAIRGAGVADIADAHTVASAVGAGRCVAAALDGAGVAQCKRVRAVGCVTDLDAKAGAFIACARVDQTRGKVLNLKRVSGAVCIDSAVALVPSPM